MAGLRTLDCVHAKQLWALLDDPAAGVVRETAAALAGAASGVTRDGHQPGRRGEMAGVRVGGQVAHGDDELGAEYRANAGQGLDDLGLRMTAERLVDLPVNPPESVVQRQDLCRQVSHDLGGDVLAGQRGVLGLGSFQRGSGDGVGAAHAAVGQPRREPGSAASADRCRGLTAGQQHQGTLVGREVEGPLQCREDTSQHVAQSVDHPHPSATRSDRWAVSSTRSAASCAGTSIAVKSLR